MGDLLFADQTRNTPFLVFQSKNPSALTSRSVEDRSPCLVWNHSLSRHAGDTDKHADILPKYRGLCAMGKFKSVDWRNLSAWVLGRGGGRVPGLLIFAFGVLIASVDMEDENYGLCLELDY